MTISRRSLLLLLSLVTVVPAARAQAPADNPVSAYYSGPEGYPAWTDGVRWSRAIDMKSYAKGTSNFEKFENARDELAAQGGGVLYYPAGVYDFSAMPADGPNGRGLMLKSGVVIRGETPREDKTARDGTLQLPTKFVFGFQKRGILKKADGTQVNPAGEAPRDWNIVGLMPQPGQQLKDINHVGLAYVHLVGATVFFGDQVKWGKTYGTSGAWKSKFVKDTWKDRVPDGTHPLDQVLGADGTAGADAYEGAGKGRLIFGCVFEDSAVFNDAYEEGNGPDAFYLFKFGPRVGVFGTRIFVANNLMPRPTRSFKYSQTTRKTHVGKGGNSMSLGDFVPDTTIMFDYGKTCGIDINKDAGSAFGGPFVEGVVVRDNWIYNHGHKGFNIAGAWITIQNNHNERDYLKSGNDIYALGGDWVLTLDGNLRSNAGGNGTISDNLSRAFDLGGRNLWIDGNYFNNVGSDPGNDGEGILCQKHGGTDLFSWGITRNKHEKGSGETSYIGGWNVIVHGCLIAWNETSGWVGQAMAKDEMDAAYVANKAAKTQTGDNGNALVVCPPAAPAAPKDVKAEIYGGDAAKISWSDAADNEIGFRVERSFDGQKWMPIAYRPPRAQGSEDNPPVWVDFTAPPGKPLRYRVAAINCDDSDSGASEPAATITIPVRVK